MNTFEFWLMNNPLRAFVQDVVEMKRMKKYSTLKAPQTVLEIGCGQGVGAKLIKKHFSPKRIYGIDLDPKMIARAKKKNTDSTITFQVGDVCALPFSDNTFDAVFDFGVIHHIPNWRECPKELQRVLKPGGQLIIYDYSLETFTSNLLGKIYKKITTHPYKQMYTTDQFFSFLLKLGFTVLQQRQYTFPGAPSFLLIAQK